VNKRILLFFSLVALALSCKAPPEPEITPPQPVFVDSTAPPDPVDHRMYADPGAGDAIDIEWKPDSSGNTTGYFLYRSVNDSTVGTDGLLVNRTVIAQLESTSQFEPLPTSFRDTVGIVPGATYYYQIQAYYRPPTNVLSESKPTHVDLSTSFKYAARPELLSPNTDIVDTLHGFPAKFLWNDPNNGGLYQIIVQRLDTYQYVWSFDTSGFGNPEAIEYPLSAPPLVAGVPYQWRVKWLAPYGGSTSPWMTFTVE